MIRIKEALWNLAFWWWPNQRTRALGVEAKERRLYWAIVTLGIDVGRERTAELLGYYTNQVSCHEMGIAMDELYAERMIDGRIST